MANFSAIDAPSSDVSEPERDCVAARYLCSRRYTRALHGIEEKTDLKSCLQLNRGTAQSEIEPVARMRLQLPENLVSNSVVICQLQMHACAFRVEFIYGIVLQ